MREWTLRVWLCSSGLFSSTRSRIPSSSPRPARSTTYVLKPCLPASSVIRMTALSGPESSSTQVETWIKQNLPPMGLNDVKEAALSRGCCSMGLSDANSVQVRLLGAWSLHCIAS